MKVLHLCAYYLYSHMFSHLTDSLAEQQVDCDIFVPTHKKTRMAIVPAENVYHPVCFNYYDRVWFPLKSSKIYNAVVKTMDVNQYDVLHAHTVFTDGNVAWKLHQKYGKPYIVAVRSTDIEVFFKYMIHLRGRGLKIMANASQIVFLSESHRRYLIETQVPQAQRSEFYAKSVVIPNGIAPVFHNNKAAYRQEPPKSTIKLITVGDISKRKNQLVVCAAAKILMQRNHDVTYTVIGRAVAQDMLKKLTSDQLVSYHPFMPQDKLIDEYRLSDVFVLASLKETFGLVYAEAMSQGLPVVYTKDEGFDGQFPEGKVGFRVDPTNPVEIADAVEGILNNYSAISKECVDGIRKFNWDNIAETYKTMYEQYSQANGQ